ncbi:sulfite exporter TauE/SafE family protein [Williamsia sp.]|uniref:sulfite exporter TauE/SafE family protein n=1 Tax=Williamsia sp. TaxID=1872085 RepID=UPI002F95A757
MRYVAAVAELAFLMAAGFLAGVVGYVTGLASLVSYPALLLAGLPPITANVTNTVALIPVGIGSATQARASLTYDRRLVGLLVAAGAGGLLGAVVLLLTSASTFEAVVPYLVAVASLLLLCQPLIRRMSGHRDIPGILPIAVFVIAIYGGYFGAGAGIIFLAVSLIATSQTLWQATLFKSVLLAASNAVAAVVFVIFGSIDWTAAAVMGVGCLAGGWVGPPLVAKLPATPLRIAIAFAGFGLAIWLAFR